VIGMLRRVAANEPVQLAAAARALLYCAAVFGAGISAEQVTAVAVAVEVTSALLVRGRVSPAGSAPKVRLEPGAVQVHSSAGDVDVAQAVQQAVEDYEADRPG
jgi:hypothetical protein